MLPFSEASALVTTGGPFAFTRNPMYLGFVLCLLGWAVLLGSLVPFVVVPAFFGDRACPRPVRAPPRRPDYSHDRLRWVVSRGSPAGGGNPRDLE